jgi:hypothetical protein
MKLSAQQMQTGLRPDPAFAAWYGEEFMKIHLPQSYFGVSDEGRPEMILNGRRYAEQFGFTDIRAQMRFITLMWQIGANFFVHPGFREVLADRNLPELDRIDQLYNVPKDQATYAIMNPDDRYWYPYMVPKQGPAT